jgi:hypothetical protein
MHRPPYDAVVVVKSTPNVEQGNKDETQEWNEYGMAWFGQNPEPHTNCSNPLGRGGSRCI